MRTAPERCSALGADERRVEGPVDLGAQAAHMRLDDGGFGIEAEIPDPLEQHGARHQPAAVAHEHLEQLELARHQLDLLVAAAHLAGDQIHDEVAGLQHGRFAGMDRRAARERIELRDRFAERRGCSNEHMMVGGRRLRRSTRPRRPRRSLTLSGR